MDLLAFALLALLAGVFVIDVVHDLRGDRQSPPPGRAGQATRPPDPARTESSARALPSR